jgi:ribosomal protein L11 methyltransferase
MTLLYRLSIDPSYSLEQAWNALEDAGIEILYGSEEEEKVELFAHLSSPDSLLTFPWVTACEPYALPPIDWQAQWAAHGHNFQEGYVNIDLTALGRSGSPLRLQPGSGFGDLSHPTTRLMLNMLAQHLHNQIVIDIGCGSGVLTLAAAAMGAPWLMALILILKQLNTRIKMPCSTT